MALKWGVVGAGKITTQFVKAVSILPTKEHQVIAVAAQSLERAQNFAEELKIPKAYGSYKNLAEDDDIDIVYIGNLNTQHFDVSMLMLENNKHVLCEKPMTLNERQTRELITFAQEKKLFLMEAIWSRCFPLYEKLKEILNSQIIGDVLYITASFGRPFKEVERITSKELGGGTILDLGIYTLQLVQFIFDCIEPLSIIAKGNLNENGVDELACAILNFTEGKIATVYTHSHAELPNEGYIIGTKGAIKIPRFWAPTTIITPTETINFELPKTDVQFRNSYNAGMCYEVEEVGKCIKAGLLESPKITHKESLQLARWMDKIRKDVGVVFNEDLS